MITSKVIFLLNDNDAVSAVENRFARVTPGRTEVPKKPILIIKDIEDLCVPKVHPAVLETKELLTGLWNHMSGTMCHLPKNVVSKAIVTVTAKNNICSHRVVRCFHHIPLLGV
ncbi:hypothetical protein CTI12_AA520470 [Artemisia annua]|uniref:Uncharacterized protein n=1 Tax=Artemisia annua TaxID=35608 RepID=A0A2U1L7Y7_ARTAN|nr:hypothetical protein CTI12_AA520470 [Artemisia annua]